MCKMSKISKSGYYNWLGRGPSKRWSENEVITTAIRDIFEGSFGSYGAPRVKAELLKRGHRVSRPRAARIMRVNNLFARRKCKFKITTNSKHNYPIAPNILNQDFKVFGGNQVWVTDITYIQTKQGWMYLTVIIDLFSRKIVGWSMSDNLTTQDTIISAWHMAIKSNVITEQLIFHSDRGSHFVLLMISEICYFNRMKGNRIKEIIKSVFEKAQRKSVTDAKSALAKLIAEEISEGYAYIAPKTIERAYEKYILGDKSKGEPSPETIKLLCNYLGFDNYGEYIKHQARVTVKIKQEPSLILKRRGIFWLVVIVIFGLFGIWLIGSNLFVPTVNKACMVWKQTQYEKVSCEKAYGLKIESLDEVKLNTFKKVEVNISTTFFNESNGQPLLWYFKSDDGDLEYFTAPGLHPLKGGTLKAITPYIIQKYVPIHNYDTNSFIH